MDENWCYSYDKNYFLELTNGTNEKSICSSLLDCVIFAGEFVIGSFICSIDKKELSDTAIICNRLHHIAHSHKNSDLLFPSVLTIDTTDKFSNKKLQHFNLYDENNRETMNEITSIIGSNKAVQAKISDLNNLVDRKYEDYRKFKKEDSIYDTIAFCFHLNRFNDYLSNFEKDWNHKNLTERKEIRKLRDKINSLVPNYCFLTEKNKAPFAGVEIDKYILVTDTKDVKRIYLENYQVPKFLENLIKSINTKYFNIKGTYSFDMIKGDEVLKLASEIHATNHQDLIDALEKRAEEAEALRKRKAVSIGLDILKYGLEFALEGESSFKITKGELDAIFTPKKAYHYLEAKNHDLIKNLPVPNSTNESALTNPNDQGVYNLVKKIDEFNLNESQMSNLESELMKIIEYSNIAANAKREKDRVDFLKKELENQEDYLNAVKLLTEFSKFNYMDKNSYDAIIIEENKKYETSNAANKNLREYKIIDIQRMNEK